MLMGNKALKDEKYYNFEIFNMNISILTFVWVVRLNCIVIIRSEFSSTVTEKGRDNFFHSHKESQVVHRKGRCVEVRHTCCAPCNTVCTCMLGIL